MSGSLPWLGLGLSSNLDAGDRPHPYRLWDAAPGLFDYLEYSAPVALDEARAQASLFEEMWRRRNEVPVLFHPVHFNLYGPELEGEDALRAMSEHARAVGSPWVSNDVAWWHVGGEPFPGYLYLPPPLNRGGLDACAAHALHARDVLEVPLVLENPAVTALRGEMHVLDFMAELHRMTGCDLLLDVGHLWSYQLSRGLDPLAGVDGFPWEQVVEVHIAGGVVTRHQERRFFVDDHTQPVREELFELLQALLPRCRRLCGVTFEGDGHPPEQAARTLRRLRPWVNSARPEGFEAVAVRPSRVASGANLGRAWEVFTETFGGAGSRVQDVEGQGVETDFRLAVLAQALDRTFPLSRLLVLGHRQALADFSASAEFRAAFAQEGKGLSQAFVAYTRRRLREAPDDAAASVMAFEVWAQGLAVRAAARPPKAGMLDWAPGVEVGTFPIDLSELQFAALSLKRHLGARAWATGALDWSGLDALSQIAGRAERRPWKVAVREWRGRLEVVPLNEPLSALMTQIQRGVGWKELAPELQKLWPEAQALGLVTLSEPAARFASGPGLG